MTGVDKQTAGTKAPKIPVSVLVVMFSKEGRFLLIERADKDNYWQSVTGSLDFEQEPPLLAATRELFEETGIAARPDAFASPLVEMAKQDILLPGLLRAWPHQCQYEIFEHWRHRYANGVTQNTEHWFYVCIPDGIAPVLHATEHTRYEWCDAQEAAARCFSPNNAKAILELASKLRM